MTGASTGACVTGATMGESVTFATGAAVAGACVGVSGIIGDNDGMPVGKSVGAAVPGPVVGAVEGAKGQTSLGGSPKSLCNNNKAPGQ